jgi:hypothetical protein
MGQKANLLTVRKTRTQTNLLTSNPKLFIYGLLFIKFLEKLLRKKNVLLVSKEINFESNKCFLKCAIFFKASKLSSYQQKHKLKKQQPGCEVYLDTLAHKHFALFDNNFIQISFINLNKSLKKESLRLGFLKIRRFLPSLFARRFTFFIDFVKLSSLFSANKIPAESFLFLLGFIFRTLPKKKHNMFLIFSQILFLSFMAKTAIQTQEKQILGVKFLIKGRLKGKPRSNVTTLLVGSVPVQSLEKDIQFSKLHVNTVHGVFGFQVWIYRK